MEEIQGSNFKIPNKSQIPGSKSQKPFNLRERLFNFSKRILQICKILPKIPECENVGKQLANSGTSIAANFEEADGSLTKRDFINKVGIARKKDDLIRKKQKYEELINDTQNRIETWLQRAEDTFSFAETAKKRFETGTLDDKRQILSCLGSNLILTGRKLRISVYKSLALFQEVAPAVQNLHNRLEPMQVADSITDWETLYAQNKKWGPSRTLA